jgi:Mg-chelatase subunit ChlD
MNDLAFWRSLRHRRVDDAELVAGLREVAAWPVQERLPFLGFLPPLVSHPAAGVRAAALGCLGGCFGATAYEHLVAALNDPEEEVRQAAVEALRTSLTGADVARWAHALFHPRADVRRAALRADGPFPPPDWWAVYLLADPANADVARARFDNITPPGDVLPLLLDFARRGVVTRADARRWVSRVHWSAAVTTIGRWGGRDEARCQFVTDCLTPGNGRERLAEAGFDSLDGLFELFADTSETEAEACRWLDTLLRGIGSLQGDTRRRIAAALVVAAQRFEGVRLAKVAAILEPRFFTCPWLPRGLRRAALQACYDLGESCPNLPDDAVHSLITADVCQGEGGLPGLWAVGAVLHFFAANPYQRLLAKVNAAELAAAFNADPEGSALFFRLADRSPLGRRFLIRELCLQPRPRRARLLARLCEVLPVDGLDFLEGVEAIVALDVVLDLIERDVPLSERKTLRLARQLAEKLVAGQVGPFVAAWLARPTPQDDSLGLALLGELSRRAESRLLDQAARSLPVPQLRKFLVCAAGCAGFPYDRELALAAALAGHGDESIRAWATARLHPPRPRVKDEAEKVGLLRAGLCHRLRGEPDPVVPDVETCASLLASHDLLAEVDAQFARFASPDPDFLTRLDEEMVRHWRGELRLPLVGHLWLHRWDEHALAFGTRIESEWGGLAGALAAADDFRSAVLRRRLWETAARLVALWRWRDRERFASLWTARFGDVLVRHLTSDASATAAELLILWHRTNAADPVLLALKPFARAALVDATDEIRTALARWIDARGFGSREQAAPFLTPPVLEAGVPALEGLLHELPSATAEKARGIAHQVVELGEPGVNALGALLCSTAPAPHAERLADTIGAWPEGEALRRVRAALHDPAVAPENRYRIAEEFFFRGERGLLPVFLDALTRPGPTGWFTAEDWNWLIHTGLEEAPQIEVERRLAVSPHPHAYDPAVMGLTRTEIYADVETQTALIAFLECGTERMRELRVQAAGWLSKAGVGAAVLPLLLQADVAEPPTYPDLLAGQPFDVVLVVARGLLLLQRSEEDDDLLVSLLLAVGVDEYAKEEGLALVLQSGLAAEARKRARASIRPSYTRDMKLRRVADTFAWGVRVGRELTGKLFSVEMIAGEKLGYTRFTENKIYITPLPILRGEINGRQVVRALILHEFGHHMYHRSPEALAVWKQSEADALQRLLNLVSDEHLERNLRALDRRFGDQLKQLAAYAFQHTTREIPVDQLLSALGGASFQVLAASPLGVARRYGCVAIYNGRVLMLMEKFGLSFARFVRALRMGLGNRHADPKVEAGLALFRGKFRKSDMPRLYEIAKKLREIFGQETDILNSFDQDASCGDEAGDWDEVSEGITNDEVQSEVQSALQGKDGKARSGDRTKGGRGLNLGPDEHFDLIDKVQPMAHDPAQHAAYAQQVRRPAELLRHFLKKLGIGFEQQRLRLSGKSFDRTRARAVVLKGDPRMLIARELRVRTDLFIGVVVDCSGSMSHNGNIEKAKLFGTLLAESARNNPGVDVRLFGFTDKVVYDAGHANRCAVHALQAGGGNNDAAGLWHAALAAKASRRRAKLLVMVSDGAPTECTVTALRALVTRLTKRMKMCCAQVAVCPLEHQCFPNYILLDDANVEASVRRFGAVMAKLVQQALRGG